MKNKIAARIQADSQSQVKTDSSLAKVRKPIKYNALA